MKPAEQLALVDVPRTLPDAESDDWFTPLWRFEPFHRRYRYTVDAAGHPEAPVTQSIGRWYGLADDGLSRGYLGERVWCNPPYSDIEPWVALAERSMLYGGALVWSLLLPCWMDRAWWHKHIEPHRSSARYRNRLVRVELDFFEGRIRFGYPGNPEARGHSGGGFDPSVLVTFRRLR